MRTRYGTIFSKTVGGKRMSVNPPAIPATVQKRMALRSLYRSLYILVLNGMRAIAFAGRSPRWFVTWAVTGGSPVARRTGREKKLPPPATEFRDPDRIPMARMGARVMSVLMSIILGSLVFVVFLPYVLRISMSIINY